MKNSSKEKAMMDIIQDRHIKNDLLLWDFINLDRESAGILAQAYFKCNWLYSDIPERYKIEVADIIISLLVRTRKDKDFYYCEAHFTNDEDEIWYLQELYNQKYDNKTT